MGTSSVTCAACSQPLRKGDDKCPHCLCPNDAQEELVAFHRRVKARVPDLHARLWQARLERDPKAALSRDSSVSVVELCMSVIAVAMIHGFYLDAIIGIQTGTVRLAALHRSVEAIVFSESEGWLFFWFLVCFQLVSATLLMLWVARVITRAARHYRRRWAA